VAIVSALRVQPVETATVIAGDMSVQGNLEAIDTVGEFLLITHENGALKIALPLLCETEVAASPRELQEGMHISYYSTPGELIDHVLARNGVD